MKKFYPVILIIILLNSAVNIFLSKPAFAGQASTDSGPEPKTVSFMTEDSIWVFGDIFDAQGANITNVKELPVILLLHQSGSNSEEYRLIAPRLTKLGFNCLAIDARGGGFSYGRANRTNANLLDHGGGPEAYWDFKAALKYLSDSGYTGKITMWGSSYSAGRMFAVLSEKPENVVAGLSFSPGAAFARKGPNGEKAWAEQVTIPIFMSWSPEEFNEDRKNRFDVIDSEFKFLHMQKKGIHGSSTLNPMKNPDGYKEIFLEVEKFLLIYSK